MGNNHSSKWDDRYGSDNDSIWNSESLHEDVASDGFRDSIADFSAVELLPSVIIITQEIQKAKYRLFRARSRTLEMRREHKTDCKLHKSRLKKIQKRLRKMAGVAPNHFGYFDYFNIVKRAYNVKKKHSIDQAYYQRNNLHRTNINDASSNTKGNSASQKTNAARQTNSTAIVSQSNSLFFSIFSLWEAYLLKKTHIAAMQQKQQQLHKKGWNKIVLTIQKGCTGAIQDFDRQKVSIEKKIETLKGELCALKDTYLDLVRCQDELIQKLQEQENLESSDISRAASSDDESLDKEDDDERVEPTPKKSNTGNNKPQQESGSSIVDLSRQVTLDPVKIVGGAIDRPVEEENCEEEEKLNEESGNKVNDTPNNHFVLENSLRSCESCESHPSTDNSNYDEEKKQYISDEESIRRKKGALMMKKKEVKAIVKRKKEEKRKSAMDRRARMTKNSAQFDGPIDSFTDTFSKLRQSQKKLIKILDENSEEFGVTEPIDA